MIEKTILSLVAATSLLVGISSHSVGAQQQDQPESQQRPLVKDPIRELNLSPEQRERIREIRQQLQAERVVINQRLRETNEALDKALDADNPDESLVEQCVRDFAAAQVAAVRLRVSSEVRIRRVLTPQQLVTLRDLRNNIRNQRREMRRQERVDRRRGLPNQRNGLAPLFPKRSAQPQEPRP